MEMMISGEAQEKRRNGEVAQMEVGVEAQNQNPNLNLNHIPNPNLNPNPSLNRTPNPSPNPNLSLLEASGAVKVDGAMEVDGAVEEAGEKRSHPRPLLRVVAYAVFFLINLVHIVSRAQEPAQTRSAPRNVAK